MNIAYLSTFYPFRGGIAQFNARLFRELEKTVSVSAYTFKRQYPGILFPGTSQYVTENDTADKIDALKLLDTINPLTYWSTARKILKDESDLLLTKFWMPYFGFSLGQVSKILKNKNVKSISVLDNVKPHEKRPGDDWLINFFLKNTSGFIAMSETVRDDLLEYKPDAVYKMMPHPLYDHFPQRLNRNIACEMLNIDADRKVLLFFGFIRDYKGLDIMLEALEALPDEYILVIAGEVYGNFDKYEKIIRDRGLFHKVKMFIRYISDDEVPPFFSAADVCVLPYKTATQSGIVGISYHFGLPVIATDVGGLGEMVKPYGTGLMVEKPEQHLLSAAIADYFNLQMRDIFEKNIVRYKQLASWENMAKEILSLYQEL